jgi:hypothetical protein
VGSNARPFHYPQGGEFDEEELFLWHFADYREPIEQAVIES